MVDVQRSDASAHRRRIDERISCAIRAASRSSSATRFVTDDDGLKMVDITDPTRPVPIPRATVRLKHAGRFYVARTYAYVANGPEGLAIIDVENPERPRLDQMFNAGGALNDTRAVQIGSVSASQFALVADGKNGLRVIQLISPDTVPGAQGFSPRPNPKLIATYPHERRSDLRFARPGARSRRR